MSPRRQLSSHAKSMLEYLHKKKNLTVNQIIKQNLSCLRGYSRSTIYRHATGKFGKKRVSTGQPVGRPRLLQERDKRNIGRSVKALRREIGTFTSVQLQKHADLNHVDNSTVRKTMYSLGYKYRCTRKKGVLTGDDLKQRVSWARKLKKKIEGGKDKEQADLWREGVNMYVDIVGFEYKVRNIMDN